jgi:uncharacterized protein with GYD domain
MKRFVAKPSDRAAVVRELAESAGGSLESYYWMFGQYDGAGVFVLPNSHTTAAVCLAAVSSGASTRFETHELIEASDLTAIAERARGIAYQPPDAGQPDSRTAEQPDRLPGSRCAPDAVSRTRASGGDLAP